MPTSGNRVVPFPVSPLVSAPASQTEPTPSTVESQRASIVWLSPLARERLAFLGVGGVFIVSGGLVAAIDSASPISHGSWLAAYLVLVGGVAQLALGFGCLLLAQSRCSRTLRRVQLWLWNIGTLTVAGGVLSNLFGVVLVGSVVVAAALGSFARASGPLGGPDRNGVIVYRLVIGLLAVSVLVGAVLTPMTTTG